MSEQIDRARALIRELYLSDNDYPFCVGYSGGKDSTLLLQLIWEVAAQSFNGRQIIVGFTDTGVEEATTLDFIEKNRLLFQERGDAINLTFSTQKPLLKNSFFVTLLGKGKTAPAPFYRWCTGNCKIEPSRRFFRENLKSDCFSLVGCRKDESTRRRRKLEKTNAPENFVLLRKRPFKVYEYNPLADVRTDDVFRYLTSKRQTAWGLDVGELLGLYEKSGCRKRVGCWRCTLCGEKQNDEAPRPLVVFRRTLRAYSADVTKRNLTRTEKQRARLAQGIAAGRFTLEARAELLDKLLKTQEQEGRELITQEEIELIRQHWADESEN